MPLTPEQGRSLARSGVVNAAPSPYGPGVWQIGPAGKVGAARIGDIEIHIKPKVPIARLLFLAGYSQHAAAWRPETVAVAEADDLVPAVAQALWRQTERATHQGLLPGYILVEESSQVLRGRLRESEQLHRHHGLPLPLEIRTTSSPSTSPKTRSCGPPASGCSPFRAWMPSPSACCGACSATSPTSHRCPAAIRSLPGRQHGSTPATTQRCALLSSSCARPPLSTNSGAWPSTASCSTCPSCSRTSSPWPCARRSSRRTAGAWPIRTGTTSTRPGRWSCGPTSCGRYAGSAVAVIDAKYKAEKPAGYPNADLYQLLAYCTVLGLRNGHLVYAKGNAVPAHHIVRHSGVEIFCHAIDLGPEPSVLLAQMHDLADRVAATRFHGTLSALPASV